MYPCPVLSYLSYPPRTTSEDTAVPCRSHRLARIGPYGDPARSELGKVFALLWPVEIFSAREIASAAGVTAAHVERHRLAAGIPAAGAYVRQADAVAPAASDRGRRGAVEPVSRLFRCLGGAGTPWPVWSRHVQCRAHRAGGDPHRDVIRSAECPRDRDDPDPPPPAKLVFLDDAGTGRRRRRWRPEDPAPRSSGAAHRARAADNLESGAGGSAAGAATGTEVPSRYRRRRRHRPVVQAPVVSGPRIPSKRVESRQPQSRRRATRARGTGGGAGTGTGTGVGEGTGGGLGAGSGGGEGGGPYRPGAGIDPPALIREMKATYTDDARRRGIEGEVLLEIVILRDGSVGDVRVRRGLDRRSGPARDRRRAAVAVLACQTPRRRRRCHRGSRRRIQVEVMPMSPFWAVVVGCSSRGGGALGWAVGTRSRAARARGRARRSCCSSWPFRVRPRSRHRSSSPARGTSSSSRSASRRTTRCSVTPSRPEPPSRRWLAVAACSRSWRPLSASTPSGIASRPRRSQCAGGSRRHKRQPASVARPDRARRAPARDARRPSGRHWRAAESRRRQRR